ncbi:MAG: extracellular solute-binding protein [Candidatus Moraniibacteriota bacterium]|nr:MAG: extracellular solute-binding protein [Candidatus Moranbacteria bacterium]
MKRRISLFASLVLLGGSLLTLSGCGGPDSVPYEVSLEIWGTFDDSDAFNQIANEYTKLNPYVKQIKYRKIAPETYKEDLLDAMASGNGPDIFMLRNTWLSSFADKAIPAPANFLTEKTVRDSFVDVVADDFLNADKQVMAVPLSVDSLALYYNKDIFNAAGITAPPKTWEELVAMVPLLVKQDEFGNINQAAIALGAGENVNRSSDILLNLMQQYGAPITDPHFGDQLNRQALEFYTQFARLGLPTYTWNQRQHYSIDAFYEGTLGMMINYSYHYSTIKQKNAKLNFAIAPLPQFRDRAPVNFANYWGFAVTKNKTQVADLSRPQATLSTENYQQARVHEAWQFLSYLTLPHPTGVLQLANAFSGKTADFPLPIDPAKKYIELTKKPAARRDLIDAQKDDVVLSPFVAGNLIAKSWKPGNIEQAEGLLVETISAVVRGERTVSEALSILDSRYTQLNRR